MAIAINTAEEAGKVAASTNVQFPILADVEGTLVDHLGLRHEGADPRGGDVAESATVIVRPDGTVAKIIRAENYRVRPRVAEILDAAVATAGP